MKQIIALVFLFTCASANAQTVKKPVTAKKTPAAKTSPSTVKRAQPTPVVVEEPTPSPTPAPAPARASDPELAPPSVSSEPARQGEPSDDELLETRPVTIGEGRIRTFNLSAQAMLLSIPVPFKWGVSASYISSPSWTYELSYLSGAIELPTGYVDLGGFKEKLISLNARRFAGRTFNFIFGASYQSYAAKLGNDIIARSNGGPGVYDLLDVQTLGLQLGLANRWTLGGFTIGVDWFTFNIPIVSLKSEAPALTAISNGNDRGVIEDALKILRRLPTGSIGKIALGYSF